MAHRRRNTRGPSNVQRIEVALAQPKHCFAVWHVREPDLVAGGGNRAPEPKTAIRIHGPCGADGDARQRLRLGVIGCGETVDLAHKWIDRCRGVVANADPKFDPFLAVPFPGVSADDGFGCHLEVGAAHVRTLSQAELARCTKADRDQAVEETARIVATHLEAIKDSENPPDVVIVTLPDEVKRAAGGGRRKHAQRVSAQGQSPIVAAAPLPRGRHRSRVPPEQLALTFFDTPPPPVHPVLAPSRTLHRAIKAEGMRQHLPTQLAWPTTFSGGPGRQDDATRAWNFWTAVYYKALGVPWRVTGLPKNTCYVGISFFQPIGQVGHLQTSMAQAFSDRGEGFVLRGGAFDWNTRTHGPPRLPRNDARLLLAAIIENYAKHHSQPPNRVVVHKSSLFDAEERAGFADALDAVKIPYFDLVTVGYSPARFFRIGHEPPIRGTVIEVERKKHIVYTRGYVPFLKMYPGMRIPTPLLVVHDSGSGAVRDLMEELFSLTRLNWNSADFASAEPITLKFSRQIGLIMSELPSDIEPERHFKYYM